MKITCQACEAKYTIADEKVQGKVAKIRCKKCGATIVVNGPGASAEGGTGEGAAAGADGAVYTVSVADGDQRTMTVGELVAAHQQGVVTGETYVWAEGMDDWLPIASVPALSAALSGGDVGGAVPMAAPSVDIPAPEPSAEPRPAAAAARREAGRGKAFDLFGGAAQAGSEEEVATSARQSQPPSSRRSSPPGGGG
jgi:predicted Zn finger-like uncharacterized protein